MFRKFKSRILMLKGRPWKIIAYILLCVITFICFTIVPFWLWMNSGVMTRGFVSIRGNSMLPNISNNEILYVKQPTYERGEIVVFRSPYVEDYYITSDLSLLKRIVGLPGETVEITADGVLIDGQLLLEDYSDDPENTLQEDNKINELILSDSEYFLLGDNRDDSLDSRHVGAIESTRFLYALTTEPNEYTKKIMTIATIVALVNFCCILVSPYLWLIVLTGCNKRMTNQNQIKKNKRH